MEIQKIKSTIEAMKKEISKSNDEKEALLKKIEQSKLEHVNYQEVIKQKDEEYYKKCLNTIREMFDTELNYYYELSFEYDTDGFINQAIIEN